MDNGLGWFYQWSCLKTLVNPPNETVEELRLCKNNRIIIKINNGLEMTCTGHEYSKKSGNQWKGG